MSGFLDYETIPPLLEHLDNPTVHSCRIQHTSFGNEGCSRLFRWLRTGFDQVADKESSKGEGQDYDSEYQRNCGPQRTRPGFPKRLSNLELIDVEMGDVAFEDLVDWLKSSQTATIDQNSNEDQVSLAVLNLTANEIVGRSKSAEAFISAFLPPGGIGSASSSLRSLNISNNPLSSSFRQTLFSHLSVVPSLRHLGLARTGMDITDANALASHIGKRMGKCKLVQLHASANHMRYKGLQTLVNAMEECWTLEKVEMYSNGTMDEETDPDNIREDLPRFNRLKANNEKDFQIFADDVSKLSSGSGCGQPLLELRLRHILARNVFLKRQVKTQALDLLNCSRLTLHKSDLPTSEDEERYFLDSCHDISNPASTIRPLQVGLSKTSSTRHIFTHLPTEIQLAILGHLAPLLSISQKIRIFEYATDKNTLPKLEHCLPDGNDGSSDTGTCVVDPMTVGQTSISEGIRQPVTRPGELSPTAVQATRTPAWADENYSRNSSTVHQKQKQFKQDWLELVGCESYDPREVI